MLSSTHKLDGEKAKTAKVQIMETAIIETPGDQSLLQWKDILAPRDFSEPSKETVKTAIEEVVSLALCLVLVMRRKKVVAVPKAGGQP
jgi:hypothetical protein